MSYKFIFFFSIFFEFLSFILQNKNSKFKILIKKNLRSMRTMQSNIIIEYVKIILYI